MRWWTGRRRAALHPVARKRVLPMLGKRTPRGGLDGVVAAQTRLSHVDGAAGWCAHVMEQRADNRLIGPLSEDIRPLTPAGRS